MTPKEQLALYMSAYKEAGEYKPAKVMNTGGLVYSPEEFATIAKLPQEKQLTAIEDMVTKDQDKYWNGRHQQLEDYRKLSAGSIRLQHVKKATKQFFKFMKKYKG